MGEETEPVTASFSCSRYSVNCISPCGPPCDVHSQVPVNGPGFGFGAPSLASANPATDNAASQTPAMSRTRFITLPPRKSNGIQQTVYDIRRNRVRYAAHSIRHTAGIRHTSQISVVSQFWRLLRFDVIPAKAGIQSASSEAAGKVVPWMPAFAGMTTDEGCQSTSD